MGSSLEQNVNMTEKYRGHSIYAYCSSVNGHNQNTIVAINQQQRALRIKFYDHS